MKKLYALFLPLILFVGLLASCGGGEETKYRVNFMVDEAVYYTVETNGKEEITLPTEPTKQYYDFSGWYLDNNVWEKEVKSNTFVDNPISSDTFVYAKWVSNTQADLSLSIDGFEKTNTTFSATVANSVQSINLSNKAHVATSSTWVVATDAQARNVIQNKTITLTTGNNTYYVKVTAFDNTSRIYTLNIYRKAMFTVTFDANGGTPVTSQSVEEGTVITAPITTREGYTFLSWGYDFTNPISANMALTASWEANSYVITYDPQGGEIEQQEQPVVYDEPYALINPTKEGYDFVGWYIGDTKVEAGIYQETNDITLVAHWQPTYYSISYSLNGGTVSGTNPNFYTIEDHSFTLVNPTKEGFNFLGWSGTGIEGMSSNVTIEGGSIGNRTYTANWEAIDYSISYDLDGGSLAINNLVQYNVLTPSFNLNNPYKSGYTFIGWTGTDLSNPTMIVTIPTGSIGNRTYTANWEVTNYTISYNLDGGTVSGNPESYNMFSESITLNNPTKEDWIFLGWTGTSLSEATMEVTIPTGSSGNRTYTANWRYDGYTISYHLGGGTNSENNPIYFKDTFDDIYLEDATRSGYLFAGWYDNPNYEGDNIDVIPTGTDHDIDLYAKWTPITYYVEFDSNGGEGQMSEMEFTYGVSQNLLPNEFTRYGYDFLGWSESPTATTAQYANEASVSNLCNEEDDVKTLYAVWRGVACTIYFDSGDGTGGTDSATAHYQEGMPRATAPTAPYGFEFIGYFDENNVQYYDSFMNSIRPWNNVEGATLYAWYQGVEVVVIFDNGTGSGQSSVEARYSEGMPSAYAPTSPTGYYFLGYFDENNVQYYDGDMNSVRSWNYTTQVTLHAHYAPITSYIYFVAYSGASVEGPYEATYGQTLPSVSVTTSREGYTFVGYYDDYNVKYYDADLNPVRTFDYTHDVTLRGRWEGDEFTVTLDHNDGTGVTNTISAAMGSFLPTGIEIPTRENYIFIGYEDENGTVYYDSDMNPTLIWNKAYNATLYAMWEINQYTMYVDVNNGSGTQYLYTVSKGLPLPELTNVPTRTGYTFTGYYDYNGKKYYDEELNPAVSAWDKAYNSTIYAHWEGLQFTVTLDAGEGNGGTTTVIATYGSYLPDAIAPSLTGYSFAAYRTEGGTYYYNSSMHGSRTWNILEDTTLYAEYTANSYYVTLDHQGGESTVSSLSVTYDASLPSFVEPTRYGYVFLGYFDEDGVQYYGEDMQGMRTYQIADDITLYAHWEIGEYIMSFSMNGGTPAQEAMIVTYQDSLPELTTIPTKENYTFAGYFDSEDVQYYDEELNPVVSAWDKEHATLYAHYTGNPFEVTLDNTDGEGGSEKVIAHFGDVLPEAEAPSLIGYTFLGYFDENDVQYYDEEMNGIKAWDKGNDATLYAQYELTTYYISLSLTGNTVPLSVRLSFDLNGAEGSIPTQVITAGNGMVYPEIPTRSGYLFAGWYQDSECTQIFDFTAPIETDKTVYAKWLAVPSGTIAVYYGANTINIVGGSGHTTYYAFVPLVSTTITVNVGKRAWIGIQTSTSTTSGSNYNTVSGSVIAGQMYYVSLQSYMGNTGSTYEGETYLNFVGTIRPSDGGVIGSEGEVLIGSAHYNYPFTFEVPERYGYDFLGWFENEEDGGRQFTGADGVGLFNYDKLTDYSLVAHWVAHTAIITFDHGEGESEVTSIEATFGEELPVLVAPTRDYYDFVGYFDNNGTQYYNADMEPLRLWDKDSSATLYARYTPKSYVITFDPVDGETEQTSVEATYTQDLPVAAAPTLFGHEFIGYFDADGVQYYDEAMVGMRVWDKHEDATLYARYERGTYEVNLVSDDLFTVTFDLNGGEGEIPTQHVSLLNPLIYPTNPTKENEIFEGWYLEPECINKYDFSGIISSDFTLYAHYVSYYTSTSYWAISGSSSHSTNQNQSGTTAYYRITAPVAMTVTFDWRVSSEQNYDSLSITRGSTNLVSASGTRSGSLEVALAAGVTLYIQYSKDGSVNSGEDTAYIDNLVLISNVSYEVTAGIEFVTCELTYGELANVSIIPEYLGHIFLGWYEEIGGTGKQYTDAEGNGLRNWDQEEGSLYAKWELGVYTVIFDHGAGTSEVTSIDITFGDDLPELIAPTLAYYDFDGYFDEDGVQYYDENMQALRTWDKGSDATLYARYTPCTYTITFDVGEGETEQESVIASYERDLPVASAPTYFGHEFLGYFDEDGVQYYDEAMVSMRVWDKPYDATLYAHYECATYDVTLADALHEVEGRYTVSFDLMGGEGDVQDQVVTPTNPLVYPTNPTRGTEIFEGWYLEETYENKYDFTGEITEDFTLYARYVNVQRSYSNWVVSGDSVRSTNTSHSSTSYFRIVPEARVIISFNYSVSSEQNFDWFTCTNAGTQIFRISGSQSGSETLTVNAGSTLQFSYSKDGSVSNGSDRGTLSNIVITAATSYTVTATVGTMMLPQVVSLVYGEPTNISIIPTLEGCSFLGWYDGEGGTGYQYTDGEGNSLRNWDKEEATLYARWSGSSYTMYFETNGGSTIEPIVFNYGDEIVLPLENPTKEGKSFAGWYDEALENEFNLETMPARDVTLYAKWDEYSISTHYDDVDGIGVNTPITADLFNLQVVDNDGNEFEGNYEIVSGTKEAGQTISIRFYGVGLYETAWEVIIPDVRVYGTPTLYYNGGVTSFAGSPELTSSHFGALASDSFGESLEVVVTVKEITYSAGDFVTIVLTATDAFGNTKVTEIPNIEVLEQMEDIWDGTIGDSFAVGSGTIDDPYQISTGSELALLSSLCNNGNSYSGRYFKLTNNIDLNHKPWTPIGKAVYDSNASVLRYGNFSGVFDGNGHTIRNMKIYNENFSGYETIGLFGCINNGAQVKNLVLKDVNIYIQYVGDTILHAGSVAAEANNATLSNLYVDGNIHTKQSNSTLASRSGGVVGLMDNNALIENVVCRCNVTNEIIKNNGWNAYTGGIASSLYSGTVKNCLYDGNIISTSLGHYGYGSSIVGMVDRTGATIINTIGLGSIETDSDGICSGVYAPFNSARAVIGANYHNISTSGSSISSMGTQITSEQLENQEWIENSLGWDFENTWIMKDSRPTLRIAA